MRNDMIRSRLYLFPLLTAVCIGLGACGGEPRSAFEEDGTEVNRSEWLEDGIEEGVDYLGRDGDVRYDVGFRFPVPELDQGEEIAHARIRFASLGSRVDTAVNLVIEGVLKANPGGFSSEERPSQKGPKTERKVHWKIEEEWLAGNEEVPLYYDSPDLSPVINEILAQPGWGSKDKAVIITVRDDSEGTNYITFCDAARGEAAFKSPAKLQVFETVYSAFLGKEFLGRVTDRSVVLNLYSLVPVDAFVEFGSSPGNYTKRTGDHLNRKACEITLDGLEPNHRYYYRLVYRSAGQGEYLKGREGSFHTQRPAGERFTFAVQADEHLFNWHRRAKEGAEMRAAYETNRALYGITLKNIENSKPDFLFSMGDFAITEHYTGRHALTLQDATERYLLQRKYLDSLGRSIPFFLVIGNHEGENGWYYTSEKEELRRLAAMSMEARKRIIPNPCPDAFYRGNRNEVPGSGLREDYYAFTWGDALFVVLNPFSYTKKNARSAGEHQLTRRKVLTQYSGWDWTLGKAQYDWLHETLHASDAKWKFVFIHHLTSTITMQQSGDSHLYGRGGIEVAKHKVDGQPSFEWGGENRKGKYVFPMKRLGWKHGAIHDMLVAEGVNMVFHGHDHFFAKQDLDGIVYQTCPQPVNAKSFCYKDIGHYKHGVLLPNSGHLQVNVGPENVQVDYVRSFLPEDGRNGEMAYRYTIH
jgi:3',5'-cyclic AMP phosphodiesterase CpdA